MEQLCQPGGDILFQCGDARHDILHGFRCLILVEIAGHGDLVAHLGLAVVDPCVGGVGQNFAGKVGVNILHQRHVFGVPQAGVRHRLAAFQDDVASLIPLGAFHHDLVVAELHALEHLALAVDAVFVAVHLAVGKLAVGGDDQLPAGIGDVVALGADALAAGLKAVAGINELHLARAVGGLILAEHPDVGGNTGVHEHIGGKLDDAVQPVVFQNILPDVAGPAAGIAAEQGRAVLDNGHLALVCQLGKAVQHKKLLPIADLGQTGCKTPHLAPGGFGFHRLLLPLPVDAEGRVGDDVLEGEPGELILGQSIAEPHIVGVAAADHHVRLGDGKGGGVELLPEAGHLNVAVQLVDALFHAAEHLAGAHGHIVNGHAAGVEVGFGQQQVGHQVDDVPAGEVRSGLLTKALREPPHQVLKDVAAVHGADLVRAKIALLGAELLDNEVEGVALHHPLDDVVKVELCQHILCVGREAGQVIPEVGLNVVRVCQQGLEGEPAGVIELVTGGFLQKAVDDLQLFHLFVGVQHRLMGGQQAVVEPLHHGHGQNDQTVLVGLERPAQHIGYVPDHGGFFGNVGTYGGDLIVWHTLLLVFVIGGHPDFTTMGVL